MRNPPLALGLALALALFAESSSAAQQQLRAQPQRTFNLTKAERAALEPFRAAVAAKDWAAAQAALPAAQAAAQSVDARYIVGDLRLRTGLGINNVAMQAQGIDEIIASGGAPAHVLPDLYRNQGALAIKAGDKAKAERAFTRASELAPNDPEILIDLAKAKNDLRKPAEAVQLLERAIAMRTGGGQAAHESWYKYALKLAFDARLAAQSEKLSRALVAAYPTRENWRDALLIYRDVNPGLDPATQLDLLRLARVSGALAGERDWYELAEMLIRAGLFAEAKAVLDEGGSKRMIDLAKPAFVELLQTANKRLEGDLQSLAAEEGRALASATGALALKIGDARFGYGEFGKAIALYRSALAKGGVDSNLVNTRLGLALALSGNRAEAEAVLKSVGGARAAIAGYILAWIAQRP